ncbi:MAG: HEPN domain-containing protein [Cyanobacteriota bacterium]
MSEAKDWLKIAKSNLKLGKAYYSINDNEIRFEELCFELQQCVEKSLKALLVHNKVIFPKTHSLSELITILQKHSVIIPENLLDVVELTKYAVETRYPDNYHEITEEEYKETIQIAEAIYNWVEEQLV